MGQFPSCQQNAMVALLTFKPDFSSQTNDCPLIGTAWVFFLENDPIPEFIRLIHAIIIKEITDGCGRGCAD